MNEYVIEWLQGSTRAAITAPAGSALKNKLVKLAEQYPEECDVLVNDDGSVFGHVPVKYIKIYRPREVSEELRQKASDRMRQMRSNIASNDSDDDFIDQE